MAWMMFAAVPLIWSATPDRPAPAAFDRHHGETLELRCTLAGFGERPFAEGADIRLWYQTTGMGAAWGSVPAAASSNGLSAVFTPAADVGADRYAMYFGAPSNAYASAVLRLRPSPGFTPNVLPAPSPGYIETDPTVPAWAKADNPPASGLTTNDVQGIISTWASSDQGEVTRAGRAIYADGANNAENATYATSAGSARAAEQADTASVAEAARAAVPGSDLANQLAAAGMTTNDVCAIVTNSLPVYLPWTEAADAEWAFSGTDYNPSVTYTLSWEIWDEPDGYVWNAILYGDGIELGHQIGDGTSNVTNGISRFFNEDSGEFVYISAHQVPRDDNALGLAMTNDLPQNVAVPQLLLKGADGNVYVVKVDSDGVLRYYRQEGN